MNYEEAPTKHETTDNKTEFTKFCQPEVYNPETLPWDNVRNDILNIEKTAFGDKEAFDEDTLKEDLMNPTTITVFLRDTTTNKIIGFSYAQPTSLVYPNFYPERTFSHDTAYIADTVIHPQYQKKGLLPILMANLDAELTRYGYSFIERDSADNRKKLKKDEETYADKIKRNNLARIIDEKKWESTDYGQQRFFRMKLPDNKK